MNKPTREEIKEAFLDVLDGMSEHDIHDHTGMRQERCAEIRQLFNRLVVEPSRKKASK